MSLCGRMMTEVRESYISWRPTDGSHYWIIHNSWMETARDAASSLLDVLVITSSLSGFSMAEGRSQFLCPAIVQSSLLCEVAA